MKKILFLMITSVVLAGCSHSLQIKNLDEYFSPPLSPPKASLRIGVTSSCDADRQNSRYITAIVSSLQRTGALQGLIYPYDHSLYQGEVDVIIDITVIPRYSGRISNFFVNWPGFLIFAPAIWGYGYNADIETIVNISRLKEDHSKEIPITTKYYFRQAEIDRTWTEIGWFEVGLIPLIGGFVFTGYDSDVTDEFITKVSPDYGPYVARKIIAALY